MKKEVKAEMKLNRMIFQHKINPINHLTEIYLRNYINI